MYTTKLQLYQLLQLYLERNLGIFFDLIFFDLVYFRESGVTCDPIQATIWWMEFNVCLLNIRKYLL